jgi:hypothetical protein
MGLVTSAATKARAHSEALPPSPRPSGERAGVRPVEYWLQFHGVRGFEPETIAPPHPNPEVIYFPPRLHPQLPEGGEGENGGSARTRREGTRIERKV